MPPDAPEDENDAAAAAARLALRCLDLTWLPDPPPLDDGDAAISALAARADTPHGPPAALCVWPGVAGAARRALDARGLRAVRVATVVNFPHGDAAPPAVADQIAAALDSGADEIDAVLPWRALRSGDEAAAVDLLRACRSACRTPRGGALPLKVILETGELREPALIRRAAAIAIDGGADFIKTSTGKVAVNATPAAVAAMLQVIVERGGGGRVGLKVAGGVATLADILRYLAMVRAACGEAALTPRRLRFGASSLLPALLAVIDGRVSPTAAPGY